MKKKIEISELYSLSAKSYQNISPLDIREEIVSIKELPSLPSTFSRIIKLASDPDIDIEKVVEIIEQDPLLTAQVIKNARSSLYGYRGEVGTIHDAIVQVLGLNYVVNLVMGLSVLRPLKTPIDGKIGLRMFWIHALASVRLMTKLKKKLEHSQYINSQDIIFCSLIHNIGLPLLGHQFMDAGMQLERIITANPLIPINKIETFTLGTDHTQLGEWLMRAWLMPKQIVTVVRHHHNPFYRGEYFELNLLTYITDYLLGKIGIGDAENEEFYSGIWGVLGLKPESGYEALESIKQEVNSITAMANELM